MQLRFLTTKRYIEKQAINLFAIDYGALSNLLYNKSSIAYSANKEGVCCCVYYDIGKHSGDFVLSVGNQSHGIKVDAAICRKYDNLAKKILFENNDTPEVKQTQLDYLLQQFIEELKSIK